MRDSVLLTGATGFLGSKLFTYLINKGFNVVILKRSYSNIWRIEKKLKYAKFYDIDKFDLRLPFEENKIKFLIHSATSYHGGSAFDTNLVFSKKILDLSIEYNIERFINTDTFYNYTNKVFYNMEEYQLSKKQFVDWLKIKSQNIGVTNMILGHIYGSDDQQDKFVPWLYEALKNQKIIEFTQGIQMRDFIYIKDVVKAYEQVLSFSKESGYLSVYVGLGEYVSIEQFVNKFAEVMKKNSQGSVSKLNFGAIPYKGEEIFKPVNIECDMILPASPEYNIEAGIKDLVNQK